MTGMTRYLNVNPGGAPRTAKWISMEELMLQAADRIRQGWTKGDFWDEQGGACALGAIADAGKGRAIDADKFRKAQAMLLETLLDLNPKIEAKTIPEINDAEGVTQEMIVEAFERTAKKLA